MRTTFKIDNLGYIFCKNCIGFGHEGEIKKDENPSIYLGDKDRCDGCWAPVSDWAKPPSQRCVVISKTLADIFGCSPITTHNAQGLTP